VSADVFLEQPGQAKLIGRLTQEDENSGDLNAYQLYASSTGVWELCAHDSTVLAAGVISFPTNTWHTMTMILNGAQIQAVIDGVTVATIHDTTFTHGMAGLGVRGWSTAQYDNFHIDLPPGGVQTIPQSQMTATATSDMVGYLASNAVDGDNKTLWQTELNCMAGCQPAVTLPQSITIALGGSHNVSELDYLPRQDGVSGGIIGGYNVYVSSDGTTFTLAASGNWPGDPTEKSARLSSTNTSYVRLEATSAVGGYIAASEINVKTTLAVMGGNPAPAIGVLSPSTANAGDAGFTLRVNGSNFVDRSVVRWNGADRATTFVDSTLLTASIPASDIATPGSATLTVFNPGPGGGSSGPQTFAINPGQDPGTGLSETPIPFVAGYALNSPPLRNDFSGWVGMKFTVGQNQLYVTSLGRVCAGNSTANHAVKLVNAGAGSDLAGGTVMLNMTGCARNQFVYGALPMPVTLLAGATYYLVSQEFVGGDQWYDSGRISTTRDAAVANSIYSWNGNWILHSGQNSSYVPPNFQYLLAAPQNSTAPAPAFSPPPGTYTSAQSVSLTSSTPGAIIYYTLDGSIPTTGSAVYDVPILINLTTTVKAVSVAAGVANSPVASGTYTIQPPTAAMPTVSPQAGSYASTQIVALSDTTAGAVIYYTTDGSAPTTSSSAYGGPIAVSSTTTINAIAVAPGLLASTLVSATYTISAPPNEIAFVTGYGLGGQRLRSNFGGWVGMKLTIGSNSLTVTSLGRLCIAGNTGVHTVQILNAGSGIAMPGGSVQVAMSGCAPGQFTSVPLSTPITLAAGGSFYLVTQESAGGDKWYDLGSISTTGDATVNNAIYSFDGAKWISISGPNTSYVPPTFAYVAAPPDPNPPFITGFGTSNSRLRNDFSGWVGMKITVGSAPLNVSYLGRVCVAGNSGTHIVKLVDATSGIDVPGALATIDMTACTAGQFVYTALPASLSLGAGMSYYLVSQEAAGGDRWYDFGLISARAVASVNSAVYSFGGRWILMGGTNMSYVPPNFK
jgi:hypothetical protein